MSANQLKDSWFLNWFTSEITLMSQQKNCYLIKYKICKTPFALFVVSSRKLLLVLIVIIEEH